MQTIGYDPQLTDTNTHHVALRNLEVFPENFARRSVFPFLTKHGVNFPMKSIREPFRIQAGWVEVNLDILFAINLDANTCLVLSRGGQRATQEGIEAEVGMDSEVDGEA